MLVGAEYNLELLGDVHASVNVALDCFDVALLGQKRFKYRASQVQQSLCEGGQDILFAC